MQLKELLTEDRAVSPVIGVILMVAITVILAAVIGTFVLGLGSNVQSTPQASFGFDFDTSNNSVEVAHNGGDKLDTDNSQSVVIRDDDADNVERNWLSLETDDAITAGDTNVLGNVTNGTTVRVVWTDSNGESSATLASQKAPTS